MNELESQFYHQGYDKKSGKIFKDGKPREIKFKTIIELVEEAAKRGEAGNTTEASDEPKQLKLGFLDKTENLWFSLSIIGINRDGYDKYAGVPKSYADWIRLSLYTQEGKDRLFKHN